MQDNHKAFIMAYANAALALGHAVSVSDGYGKYFVRHAMDEKSVSSSLPECKNITVEFFDPAFGGDRRAGVIFDISDKIILLGCSKNAVMEQISNLARITFSGVKTA